MLGLGYIHGVLTVGRSAEGEKGKEWKIHAERDL